MIVILLLLIVLGSGCVTSTIETPTSGPVASVPSTTVIYADTFFSGCAYLDANANGEVDSDDPMIGGAAFSVTLQGGGGFGDFTSEESCAFVTVPGGLSEEHWPVKASMRLPEGMNYEPMGPVEIVMEQYESRAEFLFAAPITEPPTPNTTGAITTPPAEESDVTGLPTPTIPSTPLAVVDAPLSSSGPWLVFNTEEGIWAINPDGTGLTQLVLHKAYLLVVAVSPHGGHLAFVKAGDSAGLFDLTLEVLSLPNDEVKTITRLTTTTTEANPDTPPGDAIYDIYMAVGDSAWSPDGKQLAFISAHDGLSADLYVYSLEDNSLTRLTDGPSQAYSPNWSPDGRLIVHMGANSFGTGAGYNMAGVWAAQADDSGVKTLYDPQSGDEIVAGWSDPNTAVMYSWQANCGYFNLRTIDVEIGSMSPLFEECFTNVAFDPVTASALVVVDKYVAQGNPDEQLGIYLAKAGTESQLISETERYQVTWSPEANLFFVHGGGSVLAFTTTGEAVELPAAMDDLPLVAHGGSAWAWTGPDSHDLYVRFSGQEPRQVSGGYIFRPIWSPDGETLFFHSDGMLYLAQAPDFEPVWITDELELDGDSLIAWVEP